MDAGKVGGLRQTFVTNLCNADVSPKTAQALARHSDIRLTMNVYSHADQEEQPAAFRKLGGLPPASGVAQALCPIG